jgi:hypothetical protein
MVGLGARSSLAGPALAWFQRLAPRAVMCIRFGAPSGATVCCRAVKTLQLLIDLFKFKYNHLNTNLII